MPRLAPLTPPDCDLRGYGFMPLFGARLFRSNLYALAIGNPRAGIAALKLWWEAWQQVPAGSLPNDDRQLALMADFGADMRGWNKARDVALHGFVECDDGRIYHPVVSEEAVKAYAARLKSDARRSADRERLRRWREDRAKKPLETQDETVGETRFNGTSETPVETPDETVGVNVSSHVDIDIDSRQKESSSLRSDDAPTARPRRAKATPPPLPSWLPIDAWEGFVAMRKAGRNPFTAHAQTLMLKQLGGLRDKGQDPRAVLEQAIMRGWSGLFEVKDNVPGKFNGHSAGQANSALNRTERNRLEIDRMFGGDDALLPVIEIGTEKLIGETQ